MSSAAIRKADDSDTRLDDRTIEATLNGPRHIDDRGVLSTAGTLDIGNERLIGTLIRDPRPFERTRGMTLSLSLKVYKPGSALLAVTGLLGASLAHRRQPPHGRTR